MSKTKVGVPAEQRDYKIGPGCPPKDYQYKPGQSGNPDGPPKRKTNLWVWICKYMEFTDDQIAELDHNKLTQAQQTALELVKKAKAGERCGAEGLARYIVDREEGKAVEHLVIDNDNDLTDDECEQIREALLKRHADPD